MKRDGGRMRRLGIGKMVEKVVGGRLRWGVLRFVREEKEVVGRCKLMKCWELEVGDWVRGEGEKGKGREGKGRGLRMGRLEFCGIERRRKRVRGL